jgi:L-seryl-tRNA(Ser) seleniumtransferase
LRSYLDHKDAEQIKLWQILSTGESKLYEAGKSILAALGNPSGLSVAATRAFVGGGAMPESDIPSVGIIFDETYKATKLLRDFRRLSLPVIGRIEKERFILDLKAIDPSDHPYLIDTIREIIS